MWERHCRGSEMMKPIKTLGDSSGSRGSGLTGSLTERGTVERSEKVEAQGLVASGVR